MDHSDEMKAKCVELCAQYVNQAWRKVDLDYVELNYYTFGLLFNFIYFIKKFICNLEWRLIKRC